MTQQRVQKQGFDRSNLTLAIAFGFNLVLLAGCGRGELEACKFVEIEEAEVEVDVGDVDIERAEVEMVCDNAIVDVTWPEFRRKVNVDPGQFRGNVNALAQAVSCGRYEREKKDQVWCQTSTMREPVALSYSLDD